MNWVEYIPHVLHAYRTSYHASLQDSPFFPFFLLYGRDHSCPKGVLNNEIFGLDTEVYRTNLYERTKYARTMVLEAIAKASQKARQTFNKTAKPNTRWKVLF